MRGQEPSKEGGIDFAECGDWPLRKKQWGHTQALEAASSLIGCPFVCDLGALHWKKKKKKRRPRFGRRSWIPFYLFFISIYLFIFGGVTF